jgi:nitric oxide dioxygenase
MTPDQITLVRDSFRLIEPIQEQAAVLFYRRLFELDPHIAGLFATTDMERQRRVLMQTLAVVVKGLDRLDQVGRRHVSYGVRVEDYATVGAALLWTLEQGLATAFTSPVREAWTAAFALLAGTMIDAAGAMAPADAEPSPEELAA